MKIKIEQIRKNTPKYTDLVPRGKNNQRLKDRFEEFDNYEESVPTGENYGPNLANLRDPLRVLYGKVDFHGMPVKPKKQYLKEIFNPASPSSNLALDFVADLYQEMILYVEKLKNMGKFPEDSIYSALYPVRAWQDVDSLYDEHLAILNESFVDLLAISPDVDRKLINYERFEQYYVSQMVLSSSRRMPYTKTEFALSRFSDRLYTGLSIDITDAANCGNDEEKYLAFIRDVNFPNMRQIAGRFGFRLDFNVPWRFHCDLNSPVVQKKLKLRGIYSFDQFFNRFYDKIHVEFIDYFKDTLVFMYNSFVESYDSYEEIYMCQRTGDLKVRTRQRFPIDPSAVEKKPRSHWYRKYLEIRSAERQIKFDKHEVDKIVRKAADYDLVKGGSTGEDLIEMYFIDRLDELFTDRLTMKKMSGMIEDTNNYGQY